MKNKIVFVIITICLGAFISKTFSQCPYPSGATHRSTTTFTADNPGDLKQVDLKGNEYALINIVEGFTYTFSVGNAYWFSFEWLSLYEATTNTNITSVSGYSGTSISNWVAPFRDKLNLF